MSRESNCIICKYLLEKGYSTSELEHDCERAKLSKWYPTKWQRFVNWVSEFDLICIISMLSGSLINSIFLTCSSLPLQVKFLESICMGFLLAGLLRR